MVAHGNVEAVRYLLMEGADVHGTNNEEGNTALHKAFIRQDIDIIVLLIKKGASLMALNQHDQAPWFYATDETIEELDIEEVLYEPVPGVIDQNELNARIRVMNSRSPKTKQEV